MDEIYLISKKKLQFEKNIKNIKLKDIFEIYPQNKKYKLGDITIKDLKCTDKDYEIIKLGEVIDALSKEENYRLNFLESKDIIIHFKNDKKDKTLFLRIIIISLILFLGSGMAIINFHSDVNMRESQKTLARILTGRYDMNMLLFQIPYSLGIGLGIAMFYNKIIPNFSKSEPSPLELEVDTYKNEVENYIIENDFKDKGNKG